MSINKILELNALRNKLFIYTVLTLTEWARLDELEEEVKE
jgi:hypothetical protein